jgi:hypothetical protein
MPDGTLCHGGTNVERNTRFKEIIHPFRRNDRIEVLNLFRI